MSNLGTATIIQGDARRLPIADNTVDLVVTSPPYFALRSYQDGGEHYQGQIGSEPTPTEFLDALLEVTAECVRVLKPSGSIFVNLGDKYAQDQERSRNGNGNRTHGENFASGSVLRQPTVTLGRKANGVQHKSLIGIPWRYAIRCIDDLGLILRAEIIWSKPNGLPESVTDRVRRSHEQWFHMTVRPRYYSAVDEIREAHTGGSHHARKDKGVSPRNAKLEATGDHGRRASNTDPTMFNPLGKLPGSVWTIPTEPLTVPDHLGIDHFAAFPTAWPKRIIQGWSPAGICTECDQGRRPIPTRHHERPLGDWNPARNIENRPVSLARPSSIVTLDGEACGCPNPTAPTRPSVILDPFGGTGTTALVAKALGRHGISLDMSADYCRLATWRTKDRNQLAKILGVEKAEQQPAAQLGLFE